MKSLIDQITSTEKPQPEATKPDTAEPNVKIVTEADLLAGPATEQTPATEAQPTLVQDPSETSSAPVNTTATGEATAGAESTKRGRGRPRGSTNKPRADFSDVNTIAAKVDYSGLAEGVFDLSTGSLSTIFGPEWQPRSPEERTAVVKALAKYLETKQVQDIPPGVMLCVVVALYAGPRMAVPTTANKVKPAIAWAWAKFKGFFRRKPVVLSVIPGQPNQ